MTTPMITATNAPDMLTGALAAAARGWHVFPLLSGTKRPARPNHRERDCTGTDPRCRDGHTGWDARATTDATRIRRAWSGESPAYGLGIACGPSGLVVVDLDTHKPGTEIPEPWNRFGIRTGEDVLDHLAGAHGGTITPTFTVRTPSGGTHLYYTAPEGVRYGNTAGTIGWLVDTRAHGGYVVAAPTTIGTSSYVVTDDRAPAPLPWFLIDLLGRQHRPAPAAGPRPIRTEVDHMPAYVKSAVDQEAHNVATAPAKKHNARLYVAAKALGQLIAGGVLAEHTAYDALSDAAHSLIGPGCDCNPREIDSTIRSGFHAGSRNPRTPNPRDNSRTNSRNNSRKAA
ncbi:bifunctional DNA primase/polymerase [Nocardioides sp. NBC_00850]|uniref:bifunctional DNA primase/polymerase n=1 Tax=Nocardioides sp. NBC_00850 TaxID=2976001 RepID=UPI0038676446|nr:bifunctional DNA primase/polymerase [Nocardioides sp. NBC_00850]